MKYIFNRINENNESAFVKNSVTIDWDKKESVQAKIRVMIKRILKKYGYPPEKQEQTVKTILEQAKLIADDFSNNK
jgi:type I restriction enzyme R subunit